MPVEIDGLDRLNDTLRGLAAKAQREGDPQVAVGYTAEYAVYVHENMEIWPPGMRLAGQPRRKGRGAYWDPQGRARPKFLESPLRELSGSGVLSEIIIRALGQGKTLSQALLLAGLRLQRESQQLVPVDTGNLKASAFTRLEHGSAEGATLDGGE